MLKFSYVSNLAIAGILVVPAVALQGGAAGSLEESLTRTLIALENLAGLSQRIEAREPSAVRDVLRWTEPPIESEDPGANDAQLEALRAEVGDLQTRVDLERQKLVAQSTDGGDAVAAATLAHGNPSGEASATTQGLDENMRRRLAGNGWIVSRPQDGRPAAGTSRPESTAKKATFEDEGYSADPLLLARVMYRASRYQEAFDTLEPVRSEPEPRYWMARCLEKLGRTKEALEAYNEVIEMPNAGHLVQRAQEDTEFLKWRLEFKGGEGDGKK